MDAYDLDNKKLKFKKYGIYIFLVLLILIIFIIIFFSSRNNYKKIEKEVIDLAKNYLLQHNLNVNDTDYIELLDLGAIKGTEFCSKSSGVIVTNNNGNIEYQAYLKCDDYVSKIPEKSSEYIELHGAKIMVLSKNEKYVEPGYLNKKNVEVKIDSDIKDIPGIYNVNYRIYINSILKETLTRKVIISKYNKNETIGGLLNKEYPTISLVGDTKMVIGLNEKYEEPGYSAIDYKDGRITRQVKVTGTINNKKIGSYFLTYEVTNSKGNKAVAVRQIDVVQRKANLIITADTEIATNESKATIILKIAGEGYHQTVLPNMNIDSATMIKYEATENKKYVFKIYDVYGNETVREIDITDLDKNAPSGYCIATITPKKASIVVSATDDNKINSYTYLINSKEIKTTSESTLDYNDTYSKNNVPKIQVKVQDVAGNSQVLDCANSLKLTPNTYTDVNGYNCLEPFVCYKQLDYSDTYRATSNSIGTIYNAGCQPTSMTIISTKFNRRSKNGNLYTPQTLVREIIYPDGKIVGYSNYDRIRDVAAALNLKISKYDFKTENMDILKENLRDGNPALLLVSSGCYTGSAHYMAILGINEEGKVFLSDPFRRGYTSYKETCTVNTWVDLDEIKSKGSPQMFVIFSE